MVWNCHFWYTEEACTKCDINGQWSNQRCSLLRCVPLVIYRTSVIDRQESVSVCRFTVSNAPRTSFALQPFQTFNRAVVNTRLRRASAPCWVTLAMRLIGVAFDWSIMGKHDVIHKTGNNVHNCCTVVRAGPSHGHISTYTENSENFMKFGRVVYEICDRTDRQTHFNIILLNL